MQQVGGLRAAARCGVLLRQDGDTGVLEYAMEGRCEGGDRMEARRQHQSKGLRHGLPGCSELLLRPRGEAAVHEKEKIRLGLGLII